MVHPEISFFHFHRKDAESAKKKINRYAMFFCSQCQQGLLLIVFRPLNGKQ
jgi:hypothetical protein